MSRTLAATALLLLVGAGFPHAQGRCGARYTVVRGDTLYSIARRCGGSVAGIARASGLADSRLIEPDQVLTLAGRAEAEPAAKPDERPSPVVMAYRIQPADTLYSLARWARVSVGALLAANPGIDPHKIEIGDAVRLPAGAVDPEPLRARERGVARVTADIRFGPPRRETRPSPRPPRRPSKPEDQEDDTLGM